MFDWTQVTRCCIGRSHALRDYSSGSATPDRTGGGTTVRRQVRPTPTATMDWRGPLRDSVRGRWLPQAD